MKTHDLIMTEYLLGEIIGSYQWPRPYLIEDIVDGILVTFPKSNFCFVENNYMFARITVEFLPEDTNETCGFDITDAIGVLVPDAKIPTWEYFNIKGEPSIESISDAIHKNCRLIQEYLIPVANGDFSWVAEAKRKRFNN